MPATSTPASVSSPSSAAPASTVVADLVSRLGLDQGHGAVVGLQWGDEGKGQLVDLLTEHFSVVTRFNGGNNAGHSVYVGDQKFALHLLPSGIIRPGSLNVIGNGVVVDPTPETGILKEIKALTDRGLPVSGDNLKISDRAHAVMPYHKAEDQLLDVGVAKAYDSTPIGTTGRGIGPAYAEKAHRATAIRVGDLIRPDTLAKKIKAAVSIKNITLKALADSVEAEFTPFDADALTEQALAWGEQLRPYITDTRRLLFGLQADDQRILFEGANAALLDVDHGTYPFVTSSTTCALGIGPGTGLPTTKLKNILGVAKAYCSRVGGGPHPTELDNEIGEHIRTVGREFGTTTGRPRRVGWLDLTALRYTAQLNGVTGLVLTGLSVLTGLDEVKVATAHTVNGEPVDDFLPDADALAQSTPSLKTLPGWSEPTGDCRSFSDLPKNAQDYVKFVEDFVGVPVPIVCVGPKRDQVIVR